MKTSNDREVHILLHNIRSVYNVGAIFRTADAVGITKIWLTGYSPTPVDRFGQPRSDFAKCALGAEKTVAWEYKKTPRNVLTKLKEQGFMVVAVEQSDRSVDYKSVDPVGKASKDSKSKTLVIFGTETTGISPSLLARADMVADLPMRGKKESLNVSVTAGIVLYRWFDR